MRGSVRLRSGDVMTHGQVMDFFEALDKFSMIPSCMKKA